MAGLQVKDFLQSFDGTGDVVQWLTKVDLVAKVRKIRNVAEVIPLFLEGSAFAVYNEMGDTEKKSAECIRRTLTTAFATNPFRAYEEMCRRVWQDEPVDVYLTDLRRLARLAGVTSDLLLLRAFVVGLPPIVSRELRALPGVERMPLSDLVERARCLVGELVERSVVASTAATGERRGASRKAPTRCYGCGGPHLMKFCDAAAKTPLRCWNCGCEGHLARNCRLGNETGRAGAPAAPRSWIRGVTNCYYHRQWKTCKSAFGHGMLSNSARHLGEWSCEAGRARYSVR